MGELQVHSPVVMGELQVHSRVVTGDYKYTVP